MICNHGSYIAEECCSSVHYRSETLSSIEFLFFFGAVCTVKGTDAADKRHHGEKKEACVFGSSQQPGSSIPQHHIYQEIGEVLLKTSNSFDFS